MDGSVHIPVEQQCRIGRVVSVSAAHLVGLAHNDPEIASRADLLEMGGLVKLHTRKSTVFGVICGITIPRPSLDGSGEELKTFEIELLGEAMADEHNRLGRFQRGVSLVPSLGAEVWLATPDDLGRVYACPGKATVRIGSVNHDSNLPAHVMVDDMVGKHFAVLGSTGSGKSCAVSLILRGILSKNANARVLLLDVHNEYARAFGDQATVLSPSGDLKLPYWLFNFDEIVEVLASADEKLRATQIAILNETIPAAKQLFNPSSERAHAFTVDTPVPYRVSDLIKLIEQPLSSLNKPDNFEPYLRLVARLRNLSNDSRFAFMFEGLSVRDNLSHILSRIFRVPVDGKPVCILDLSAVPSEIMNVVVSVLCRLSFDFVFWSDRKLPLLLVCEEAHRYAPQDSKLGFEPTKRALARIAKEGRKYGIALCVVSQRPSELAPSLLSQCNTLFALRMTTQKDQEYVRGAVSDSAVGLLDFLPSLRNSEAIALGEGVSVPVRLRFDELAEEHRPRSGTVPFSTAWQTDDEENFALVQDIVGRWRRV